MSAEQNDLFYESRFLDNWAGSIISNPSSAIVELVANCWDAYATDVRIAWPDEQQGRQFSIADNGVGMTREEFQFIWRAMSYDRIGRHGELSQPPPGVVGLPRPVFGKNGKGRFASFCFSTEYIVKSRKNGQEFSYRVHRTPERPLVLDEVSYTAAGVVGHGTTITGSGIIPNIALREDQARDLLGSRFLANPAFQVYLNDRRITFSDISSDSLSKVEVDIAGAGKVSIYHIDTRKADRTTKQHGIAWWVLNRAVGECKWRGSDVNKILDGRTSEAKRYTFIVQADFLNEVGAIKDDWSGFNEDNPVWMTVRPIVQDRIREIIRETNSAEREEKRTSVFSKVGNAVNALPPLSKSRVQSFINEVVDSEERPTCLQTLVLTNHDLRLHGCRIGKFSRQIELSIARKVASGTLAVRLLVAKDSSFQVFYQEACRYWLKAQAGLPFFSRNGVRMRPPHGRVFSAISAEAAAFLGCLLNSSLFYWHYSVFSDCEHVNDDLVKTLPIPARWNAHDWLGLSEALSSGLAKSASRKSIRTKQGHVIEYDEMKAARCKEQIDAIDRALGNAYGLSDEEIDFVVNFDIKYRVGSSDDEE